MTTLATDQPDDRLTSNTPERTSAPRRNRKNGTEKTAKPSQGAKAIVPELEGKLSFARKRQAEIGDERNAISLAAHMGSMKDRARLDELNREGAVLAGEIEGIEAAIAQAKARIAEAEANAAAEVERGKQREVVRLADETRRHGEQIDTLWRQSIEEYGELERKLAEIVQLGPGRPSQRQVQVACQRALVAAFIGSPLQFQIIAPNARHSVSGLVNSWTNAAEAWAGKDAA
jgi:hypothetical protein